MLKRRVLGGILLLIAVGAPALGQVSSTGSAPATAPVLVPAEVVGNMAKLLDERPKDAPPAELAKFLQQRCHQVLQVGSELEAQYAAAENLYYVHIPMLRAADLLVNLEPGAASLDRMRLIADKVLNSGAPARAKAQADLAVLQSKLSPGGKDVPPEQAKTLIEAFARKYEGTDGAAMAVVYATLMAMKHGLGELGDRYVKELETTYVDEPAARMFLRRVGRNPDIGKPFAAVLTKLDGTGLTVPDDLKGKVVLVDFWATWCEPCRAAMPSMRRLYGKYKGAGLEIVGISLDTEKAAVEQYVESEKLNWIVAYSGKGQDDPTAQKYSISAIPNVWLVGRNGKVIATFTGDAGYERLEWAVLKAIRTAEPKPQTQPSAPASAPAKE